MQFIMLAFLIFVSWHANPTVVEAASGSARVTVSAVISPVSQLILNEAALDRAKSRAGATAYVGAGSAPATLTVSAGNDAAIGSDLDAVAAATATVTDARGKALPVASSVAAADGGCFSSYAETFNWYMSKNWNFDTGKCTVSVTFTLTSP